MSMNLKRCDTYKQFKSLLEPERYLVLDFSYVLRQSLARFRCSVHKFAIEVGRHQNIPRNERICLYCFNLFHIRQIEEEFHVFFICSKFDNLRQQHLLSWFKGCKNQYNFCNLMKTKSQIKLKKIAIYIHEVIKLYEQ